jgi:hypothetical protein
MRHAARTAIEASKAAAAPDPNPTPTYQPPRRATAGQTGRAVAAGSRGFFGSVKHAGKAVWQQVMGTLFAFFALYFVQAAFTHFSSYQAGGEARSKWYLGTFMAILFSWFAVSSFVRASKKPR